MSDSGSGSVNGPFKDWWDQVSLPDFTEEDFRKAFRMTRATFNKICQELEATTEKSVAVCIWWLATGEPLRLVLERFGLGGISRCRELVIGVCTAMKDVLMPELIHWPDSGHITKSEFEYISGGIPNLGGSMHTTHIPIIAPEADPAAYYNPCHNNYSITVQGVTDWRGIFTDVFIGWPGSFSNANVFKSSTLYKKAGKGELSNVRIAANSGIPVTDCFLLPHSGQNLSWIELAFNEKLDIVLKVSEEAFCRLRRRWAFPQGPIEDVEVAELPVVVGACCVLHNICEISGEEM